MHMDDDLNFLDDDLDPFFPETGEPFECPYCGETVMPEDRRNDDGEGVFICPNCSREIVL